MILILAGILAYGNTAKNGLFWDDDEFITRNAYIRSFRYLPEWFSRPLTAGAGVNSNYYRPLLQLSFAIDYKLWGLWPAGYHLENMLWHTTAAILLYFFLKELLRQFSIQYSVFSIESPVAFSTALLWLVHPVHVEAVAYANSRGDSMAAAFILLSLVLWLRKRFWASAISFAVALLSKEFAIVTPGLIILVEILRLNKPLAANYLDDRRSSLIYIAILASKKLFRLLTIVTNLNSYLKKPFFIHLGIAIIYLLLRLTVFNFQNTLNFYGVDLSRVDRSDPMVQYATSVGVRALTFLKVLPIYAKILVWPDDLHMERTVEMPTTADNQAVIASAAVAIVILFGWALIFLKRKLAGTSEPRNRALATHGRRPWEQVSVVRGYLPFFAAGWFFISILPVSGLIPISQILAEHFFLFSALSQKLLLFDPKRA